MTRHGEHLIVTPAEYRREQSKKTTPEDMSMKQVDLIFDLDRFVEEDMVLVKKWVEDNMVSPEERKRRGEVLAQITDYTNKLWDGIIEVHSGNLTLEQLWKNPAFGKIIRKLKNILRENGLPALLLEEHEREEAERAGEGLEMTNKMLPPENFDPRWYSGEAVLSASKIVVGEMAIESHADVLYGEGLSALNLMFEGEDPRGLFMIKEIFSKMESGEADDLDLAWLKQTLEKVSDNGKNLWEVLTGYLRNNPAVIQNIMGHPAGVDRLITSYRDKYSEEVEERIPNIFVVAISNSIDQMQNGQNSRIREAQKALLKEVYGVVPHELDYEADAWALQVQISEILDGVPDQKRKKLVEEGIRALQTRTFERTGSVLKRYRELKNRGQVFEALHDILQDGDVAVEVKGKLQAVLFARFDSVVKAIPGMLGEIDKVDQPSRLQRAVPTFTAVWNKFGSADDSRERRKRTLENDAVTMLELGYRSLDPVQKTGVDWSYQKIRRGDEFLPGLVHEQFLELENIRNGGPLNSTEGMRRRSGEYLRVCEQVGGALGGPDKLPDELLDLREWIFSLEALYQRGYFLSQTRCDMREGVIVGARAIDPIVRLISNFKQYWDIERFGFRLDGARIIDYRENNAHESDGWIRMGATDYTKKSINDGNIRKEDFVFSEKELLEKINASSVAPEKLDGFRPSPDTKVPKWFRVGQLPDGRFSFEQYKNYIEESGNKDLRGFNLRDMQFETVDFTGADMRDVCAAFCLFKDCKFGRIVFGTVNLDNSDLTGAIFVGVMFTPRQLVKANIDGARFGVLVRGHHGSAVPKWLNPGLVPSPFSKESIQTGSHFHESKYVENIKNAILGNKEIEPGSKLDYKEIPLHGTLISRKELEGSYLGDLSDPEQQQRIPKWMQYGMDGQGIFSERELYRQMFIHSGGEMDLHGADLSGMRLPSDIDIRNFILTGANVDRIMVSRGEQHRNADWFNSGLQQFQDGWGGIWYEHGIWCEHLSGGSRTKALEDLEHGKNDTVAGGRYEGENAKALLETDGIVLDNSTFVMRSKSFGDVIGVKATSARGADFRNCDYTMEFYGTDLDGAMFRTRGELELLPKWVQLGLEEIEEGKGDTLGLVFKRENLLKRLGEINDLRAAYLKDLPEFPYTISDTNCQGVDFSGSNLSGGVFQDSSFKQANFSEVDFGEGDKALRLVRSDLSKADFTGAKNVPEKVKLGLVAYVDDSRQRFYGAEIARRLQDGDDSIKITDLSEMYFGPTNFSYADFSGISLSNTVFMKCTFQMAKFVRADLGGSTIILLNDSDLLYADFRGAKGLPEWISSRLNEEGIFDPEEGFEGVKISKEAAGYV